VPQRSAPGSVAASGRASPAPSDSGTSDSGPSAPISALEAASSAADRGADAESANRFPHAHRYPSRPFVRAAALVGSGGGQFAELGGALSGGHWLGSWGGRIEVGARRALSSVSADHGVALELTRYAAELDLCRRTGDGLQWGGCAGPRLERVAGLASGPSNPESDAVWLPGVGAGVFLRIPLMSRWSLSSELQGSWALRAAEANVRPWGRVYELPRLGGNLLVGIELEI
jgi:hypothetical protein